MAQLRDKDNDSDTSNLHSTMPIYESKNVLQSFSPTPIGPTFSTTSSAFKESSGTPITIQQQDEGEDKMDITAVDSGKAVHTIWRDDRTGNFDIMYKRDGADYDPTTINLSNSAGIHLTQQ